MDSLRQLNSEVVICNRCDVASENKWYFLPDRSENVKIMVISETPGPYPKPKFDKEGDLIDSNKKKYINRTDSDIWGLFKYFFGEKYFKVEKNAVIYWTHYQKCSKNYDGSIIMHHDCKNDFLKREMKLLRTDLRNVKLIIGIGTTYSGKYLCNHFGLKMERITVNNKSLTIGLKPQEVNGKMIAIISHPSGQNRNWNYPKFKENEDNIIALIKKQIKKTVNIQ